MLPVFGNFGGEGLKPPFESPHGRYPELSETFVINANAEPKEDGNCAPVWSAAKNYMILLLLP